MPPQTLTEALHVAHKRHFMFMMLVNTKGSICAICASVENKGEAFHMFYKESSITVRGLQKGESSLHLWRNKYNFVSYCYNICCTGSMQ